MGTLKEGLLGGFSGKVGNVVGVERNGTYYVRSLPEKGNDPKTDSQVKQRSRFSVVMNFLKTISPFIRIGFQSYAVGARTPYNAAMSYNIRHSVKMGEQGAELDHPRVLVSRGTLPVGSGMHAKVVGDELKATWDAALPGNARGDDVAMLLAYNSIKQQAIYDLNAAKRSDINAGLQLPSDWRGDTIEAYLVFKTADGAEVSDSIYLGE